MSNILAQTNQKQIAVLNLNASGLSPSESITLTDRLRSELVNTHEFRVIERDKMEEILTEQGFQQSGCTSDECAVEIGKLLNIHQICAGSIGKVGSLYSVTLRLIDVQSGQILATVTEDCRCPIEQILTTSMRSLAGKLVDETKKYPGLFVARGGNGDLYLKSSLTPAKIVVDGQPWPETTPTTIKNLSSGEHVIKVIKDDFIGSKVVIINPNEILDETIVMSKAHGSIKAYSNPGEADIFIEDQYYGQTPKIIKDVAAGEYLISLKKPGYLELKRRIKVNGEQYTEIDEHLVKPASLSINSCPVKATVFIRGQEMGQTPLQLHDLYPEKIYVEVVFPGYKTERKYIQLHENEAISDQFMLKELPALQITSNPSPADVYLNEILKGQTPITIDDLSEEKVKLVIKKEYFNDWQQDLILNAGQDMQLNATLTFNEGLLFITSDPPGLPISLAGEQIGKTPFSIKKPYGEYKLEINDARFVPLTEQIILNAPKIEKNYKLNFRQGMLKLSGWHQDAELIINDKHINSQASEFTLPVGIYNVKIKKSGFKTYTKKINLSADKTETVDISLVAKGKLEAFIRSAFLPGWGQGYQEKTIRTWLYPLVVAALGISSFLMTGNYNDQVSDFRKIRQAYSVAFNQNEIDRLRRQMDDKYKEVERAENVRNIFYITTGLAWLWNMLDTIILPPGWQMNYSLSPAKTGTKNVINLSFKLP
jgi:TolB-like protein